MSISILSLLLGLLLLLIPGGVLYLCQRPLLGRMCVAVGRMVGQMALVAAYVWALYYFDSSWLNLLWLLVMSLVSAWVVVRRARLQPARLWLPVAGGTFGTVLLMACYLLLVVLRPEHPLAARWFVPVAGVLLAHVLVTNIRSLSAFYEQLHARKLDYETALANGQSHVRSLLPFVGEALQTLLLPAIANLSVMGLLTLPLLLSGMLMGGMAPIEAVILTVCFVAASLSASVLSLLLTLVLADRQTFDRRGNLTGAKEV